jgi:molybdopterin-guanine dinucleotide biosynthesis protein A
VLDGQVVVKPGPLAALLAGLLAASLAGCAPRALAVTADHPASPDAPAGRLAGPPAALRSGAAEAPAWSEPQAQPTQQQQSPQSQPQPHQGHQGHQGHH